jgi:hypothetical protein
MNIEMSVRKDLVKIDIQANAYFLVYHKSLDIGMGPTIGLYLFNTEFLKFDCFGILKGHYHIFNKKNNDRLYFTEATVVEQIDKSISELTNNISKYLETSPNRSIRNFVFDKHTLISKLAEAKHIMAQYENNFYATIRG